MKYRPTLPGRKKLSPFFFSGFLVFSLVATVVLVQERQDIRKRAADGDEYAAELVLFRSAGNEFSIEAGGSFGVDVNVLPATDDGLSAVDVVLNFDHEYLTLTGITPNTDSNLKVFVPRTPDGLAFDDGAVILAANTGGDTEGIIRFGAVAFDYITEDFTNPQVSSVIPLSTLSFNVKSTAPAGTVTDINIYFVEEGATEDSNAVLYVAPDSEDVPRDILLEPTTSIQVTVGGGGAAAVIGMLFEGIDSAVAVVDGVEITIGGTTVTQTAALPVGDSYFYASVADVPPGTYDVVIKGPLHLSQKKEDISFPMGAGDPLLFEIPLVGGDLTDVDVVDSWNKVDILDLAVLTGNYETDFSGADINFDGWVDIYDLAILTGHYDEEGEE